MSESFFDARWKVFITPFDDGGVYADEIDVTDFVLEGKLSSLTQNADSSRFSVGLYTFDSFNITLNNQQGLFSDVGTTQTIFRFRRTNSKIKIKYSPVISSPICGVAIAGQAQLGSDVDVFEGIIDDSASTQNIDDQFISFKVLSFDSILKSVETPYASISNGDNISDVIEACLDQTEITNLLTVSASNINVGIDQTIDDRSDLENTSVKEAMDILLRESNSVLYVDSNNAIIVKDRSKNSVTALQLYGQASNNGLENIYNITDYANGLNQTFNFITVADTNVVSKDTSSITDFGVRKTELNTTLITNSTKRENLTDDYVSDFANPSREFVVEIPVNLEFIGINLFDTFNVDYPTVTYTAFNTEEARYSISRYGEGIYPFEVFNLSIDSGDEWKVVEKKINFNRYTLELRLKEV